MPDFSSALMDEDEGVRNAAADVLAKINPNWMNTEEAKRKVPEFISALMDEDEDVRETAADVLGKIKDTRAVEPLIDALKDENSFIRRAAADALGKINPNWMNTEEAKRKVPEFISALK